MNNSGVEKNKENRSQKAIKIFMHYVNMSTCSHYAIIGEEGA